MRTRDFSGWTWGEALSLLERAERLQRQFFHFADAWEPPVDLLETADGVRVHVALPGADAGSITLVIEPAAITVSAVRAFPAGERAARVRRLEIPYGRFARRIALPMQALALVDRRFANGVLSLEFARKEQT